MGSLVASPLELLVVLCCRSFSCTSIAVNPARVRILIVEFTCLRIGGLANRHIIEMNAGILVPSHDPACLCYLEFSRFNPRSQIRRICLRCDKCHKSGSDFRILVNATLCIVGHHTRFANEEISCVGLCCAGKSSYLNWFYLCTATVTHRSSQDLMNLIVRLQLRVTIDYWGSWKKF
ncbi:hypothetical protein B0H12DRAFT_1267976 [Mycena haematopus]|nr:hypothetical protein B0H12DRAFT_1267976 [Mycena haematopus]